jgi:PPP family 3-phenylpropionic acid transporter
MADGYLIGSYYFAYFGALGVFLPYFSLWLVEHGLSRAETTRILSLVPLMSLVAPPLAGLVADARHARGWLLRIASTAAFVAFLGYAGARSRLVIYATTALFALSRAPIVALVDATTLDHVRQHGGSYGRIRLWGSLGFLVAALAAGVLVDRAGSGAIVVAGAWGLGLCAALAFTMPASPPVEDTRAVGAWLHLLRDGRWWLFFVAAALGYMATAAYDAGFTLHLHAIGFGGRFIGVAWATGVAAEIVLMAASRRLVDAVGAERLFALTLVTGAVRWLLLSRVSSATAILCLQPLHGVTFGLFWVSGVTLARARGHFAPTAAQGLFSAAIGLGSLAGMNVTGRLLEAGGGALLYSAAAGCAALGALAAWLYARR